MSSPDQVPQIHELIGDTDIHDLLANQLVPAHFVGRDTEKFLVEGHPDLVVRLPYNATDSDEVHSALTVARNMETFGVRTPLFAPVDHRGKTYIVTERVKGQTLADTVSSQVADRTLKNIDRTYAGLTRHLTASVVEGSPTVDDVNTPDQFMVGTTKKRPRRDVLLVDLPTEVDRIPDIPYTLEYPMRLMNLSQYVVNLELSADRPLPRARQALEVGLATASNPVYAPNSAEAADYYMLDRQGYIDAAHHILANQLQLDIGSLGYREG